MDDKKDRIIGIDLANGDDMTAIAWGHRKGDTYYINTISYSETVPPELLLAIDYDYMTELSNVKLMEAECKASGEEVLYDSSGRVIIRKPYIREFSVKFAHSLAESHDKIIRMLGFDHHRYIRYRRELGLTQSFPENKRQYKELEDHIKDLYETYSRERDRKEKWTDDRSLFERSCSTEGLQFGGDDED